MTQDRRRRQMRSEQQRQRQYYEEQRRPENRRRPENNVRPDNHRRPEHNGRPDNRHRTENTRRPDKRRRRPKVTKYRKPLNINIGLIIFGIIFIYITSYVIVYLQKDHVVIYEVKEGSLAKNTSYTGFIIREENVINASSAGYVNFYAREGEKTRANNMVYTIDESGTLADTLAQNGITNIEPSKEELSSLRSNIMNFSSNFKASDFNEVYSFKYAFDSSVLKAVGLSMMDSIESLTAETGTAFEQGYAPVSGIVEYYTDGYENVTFENFTPEMLDKSVYEKKIIKNNELVNQGAPVYKLITNEQWSIIIELDAAAVSRLSEKDSINIILKKDGTKLKAGLELINKHGVVYAKLTTKNSMIRYASDRYIDIELVMNEENGLKIPVSSVVEKEFYLIPEEFAIVNEDSGTVQFLKEVTLEDGTLSTQLVNASIYSLTDGEYYVSTDQFEAGQYIDKKDSKETYAIGKKATLIGVYNINKGYADFREITKLYENNEYCIVKANSTYGLAVYDHIVLDASAVDDDQIIY